MTNPPDDLQRLLAEEPFVRRLVRQLVGTDADDVVQQTWLRALAARPSLLRRPRQWLASIVRHLVVDRRRETQRRHRHEAELPGPESAPPSSQLLLLEERRRLLVAAVHALPESLRTVLLLRFYDGLPPRRIAARLGVSAAVVSHRLQAALQELRRTLDARHGDRRDWLAALVPFAASPCELPWRELATPTSASMTAGAILMTKTKLAAAAAVAVLVTLAMWSAWPGLDTNATPPTGTPGTVQGEVAALPGTPSTPPLAASEPEPTIARQPAAVATTGSLVVHVRYADEPRACAGIAVSLGQFRPLRLPPIPAARTDASGDVRFDDLPPGRTFVHAPIRPVRSASAIVVAGATTEVTLDLNGGITVHGVVVDPAGQPVAGARIELGMPAMGCDLADGGSTGIDGTFRLRECDEITVIGARAAGHAASVIHLVQAKPGAVESVRIELRPDGGAVAGRVVDRDGQPIAGAVVRVGEGRREGILVSEQGGPPAAAQANTDANGDFLAIGVAAGPQTVRAIAAGMAPWLGSCEVAAGTTTTLAVVMLPGVTCRGSVRTPDGNPVAAAMVQFGGSRDFTHRSARSAADGTFTLTNLPTGNCTLTAFEQKLGSASTSLRGEAGATVDCEIVLGANATLRGRVVDASGAPVRGVQVSLEGWNGSRAWASHAATDAKGAFAVADCPDGTLTARVDHRGHLPFQRSGLRRSTDEVVLQLARDTSPPCRIVGSLRWPDARPATAERLTASRADAKMPVEEAIVAADGSFAFEVVAGVWGVQCRLPKLAELRVPPRSLLPGATWDVGALTLTRGGTLLVTTALTPEPECMIVTASGDFVDPLYAPLRSAPLPPGDYRLLVRGEGAVAQALPFTIREGQESTLHVRASNQPAIRQRFRFAAPPGQALPLFATCRVERDGEIVTLLTASGESIDGQLATTAWLPPGSYTVSTLHRAIASSAAFTVVAHEADPVHLVLQ